MDEKRKAIRDRTIKRSHLAKRISTSAARSGGSTGEAMVGSADLRQCDHLAHLRRFYSSRLRTILIER